MTPADSEVSPRGSLRGRMLVSATLVLVVFLGVMGLVLDNAYRNSAEQSVSERLLLHVYALIAASEEELDSTLYLPDELQEPLFNSLGSGLFGLVFDGDGNEIWRSQSALDLDLTEAERGKLLSADAPGVVMFEQMPGDQAHESLFFLTYSVIWQSAESEAQYAYVVLEHRDPYDNEVAAFRNNLWGWLVAGVFMLVGLQAAIMYWGLRPIGGLAEDLKAIEAGQRDYLEGVYPQEIEGVTRNLNLLLNREREQRERYRTTLADLAHSLKTPLAILKAEAEKPDATTDSLMESLDEQVGRMNDIVSYQLERAVITSNSLVSDSVDVIPVAEKLLAAIVRVYAEKRLVIEKDLQPAAFPGDERDLFEFMGNLLDNACKYGNTRVRLSTATLQDNFRLTVEDDGEGIEVDHREAVLKRGARLDTQEAGQGIGLAVVREIVERYAGNIKIESSDLGGAKVVVTFD